MLYLIGLGLNEKGISLEGVEACKNADEIFLEGYTVDFPYKIEELEKVVGRKLKTLKREEVESDLIVKQSGKKDIALLVYGSPLFATTHIALLQMCQENKIKYKVLHSASIFDAIALTGLQLYKFGKTASLPKWTKDYKPKSFVEIIKGNQSVKAHSLVLIDIGLDFKDALKQLNDSIKIGELIVCSNLGTNKAEIVYGSVEKLAKQKIDNPFCFVIPGELHFIEQDFIENFRV